MVVGGTAAALFAAAAAIIAFVFGQVGRRRRDHARDVTDDQGQSGADGGTGFERSGTIHGGAGDNSGPGDFDLDDSCLFRRRRPTRSY